MAAEVCTPWVLPDQLCCEGDSTATTCDGTDVPLQYIWTDEDYARAASNILFARTCYLFPGACTVSIWPCICGCCLDHPYECSPCVRGSVMTLDGYRPRDITIMIDGVELDPSAYRVQNNKVIRLDGQRWPRNNFGIDQPGAPGAEVIVTYTYGKEPPVELKIAAAALACEMKLACTDPENCALPSRVTSINRQGVGMTLMDLQQLLMTDKTGIPAVDYALDVHGKCGSDGIFDPAAPVHGYYTV